MSSSWFCLWILGPAVWLSCTSGRDRTASQPAIQDFRATPERVDLGETVTLEARYSQGTGKIEPEPGELGGPGKVQVKPKATTRYLLTVTGPSGAKVSRELTVTVGPALAINIHGLDGAAGQVSVEGPGGFRQTMQASGVLGRLKPGEYTVQAAPVQRGSGLFHPSQPLQKIQVATGTAAEVRYLPPRFTVRLPGGVPMDFVIIPAGSFTMGTDDPQELASRSGPRPGPTHLVTHARAFYLAKFLTTRAQWWCVAGDPAQVPPDPDLPADGLSYDDIQDRFLPSLERHAPGRGFSLPSEAEWEYACRAGTHTAYFFGTDDGEAGKYFKRRADWGAGSQPVGRLLPNPWGLYDLAGLCLQWCEDIEHDNYLGAPENGSAWLQPGGDPELRMLRGGEDLTKNGRSAARFAKPRSMRSEWTGFRLKASGPIDGDAKP